MTAVFIIAQLAQYIHSCFTFSKFTSRSRKDYDSSDLVWIMFERSVYHPSIWLKKKKIGMPKNPLRLQFACLEKTNYFISNYSLNELTQSTHVESDKKNSVLIWSLATKKNHRYIYNSIQIFSLNSFLSILIRTLSKEHIEYYYYTEIQYSQIIIQDLYNIYIMHFSILIYHIYKYI